MYVVSARPWYCLEAFHFTPWLWAGMDVRTHVLASSVSSLASSFCVNRLLGFGRTNATSGGQLSQYEGSSLHCRCQPHRCQAGKPRDYFVFIGDSVGFVAKIGNHIINAGSLFLEPRSLVAIVWISVATGLLVPLLRLNWVFMIGHRICVHPLIH